MSVATPAFRPDVADDFRVGYPDRPSRLSVDVHSPLLTAERIAALTEALPSHLVEYNAGNLPLSVAPEEVGALAMTAREVIMRRAEANVWMTVRNIETDPDYRALLDEQLARHLGVVKAATGPMRNSQGFLFLSSPGAVTPFHMDEEHNILIHLEGEKIMTVFSQDDRSLASQRQLEAFHTGGHRNLTLPGDWQARGVEVHLRPGDAIYVPPLAPHFVRVVGNAPALSLSVTWRSAGSQRQVYLHQLNARARARGGEPRFPGEDRMADRLKIWRAGARRRLGRET